MLVFSLKIFMPTKSKRILKKQVTDLIKTGNLEFMVTEWIIDRVPFAFSNEVQYLKWKHEVSKGLGIDPRCVCVTGSAAIGLSLNPDKGFKAFDSNSDIDIAAVSHPHFETAWHFLRSMGAERYKLPPDELEAIKKHKDHYVYLGTIACDLILHLLPFGSKWVTTLKSLSYVAPAEGRDVNVRIYDSFESLRFYQLKTLKKLRNNILTPTEHAQVSRDE